MLSVVRWKKSYEAPESFVRVSKDFNCKHQYSYEKLYPVDKAPTIGSPSKRHFNGVSIDEPLMV